jgi:uncharacterized membrane protein YedE/YeeE
MESVELIAKQVIGHPWGRATLGGLLIGMSSSLFLLTLGRILGISGIVGRIPQLKKGDTLWRIMFLVGLVCGGYLAAGLWPENFVNIRADQNYGRLAIGGLVVGAGTKMGSGCTSGHGICGIGRMNPRGIIGTCMFILMGIFTILLIGR